MNHGVILAGGIGSRFWPLSRQKQAKQFLSLIDQKSFLRHSLDRMNGLIDPACQWIVGSLSQSELLLKHSNGVDPSRLLLEPVGKNTAAAILWAALSLYQQDPDAIMVVMPADHWISPQDKFLQTISRAIDYVNQSQQLVTIGIQPHHPHTGYGYIQTSHLLTDSIYAVESFTEKPDLARACKFLEKGGYYWNAGIFVWKAKTIIDLAQDHLPESFGLLDQFMAVSCPKKQLELYESLPSISIDYGILEKVASQIALIPASFQWSDIGSWTAIDSFWDKDDDQNAVFGDCLSIQSQNNIVYSPKRTVALLHTNDMIVVDTDDVVLIAPKSKDQDIKLFQDQLPDRLK